MEDCSPALAVILLFASSPERAGNKRSWNDLPASTVKEKCDVREEVQLATDPPYVESLHLHSGSRTEVGKLTFRGGSEDDKFLLRSSLLASSQYGRFSTRCVDTSGQHLLSAQYRIDQDLEDNSRHSFSSPEGPKDAGAKPSCPRVKLGLHNRLAASSLEDHMELQTTIHTNLLQMHILDCGGMYSFPAERPLAGGWNLPPCSCEVPRADWCTVTNDLSFQRKTLQTFSCDLFALRLFRY